MQHRNTELGSAGAEIGTGCSRWHTDSSSYSMALRADSNRNLALRMELWRLVNRQLCHQIAHLPLCLSCTAARKHQSSAVRCIACQNLRQVPLQCACLGAGHSATAHCPHREAAEEWHLETNSRVTNIEKLPSPAYLDMCLMLKHTETVPQEDSCWNSWTHTS